MCVPFDFDAWSTLAKDSPESFEQFRQRLILEAIAAGNNPLKLHRLQWRIDIERQRSSNALAGCIRLSKMMWRSFDEANQELGCAFQKIISFNDENAPSNKNILEFRKRSRHPSEISNP